MNTSRVAASTRPTRPLLGTDAWSREARRVRELATRLGLALDEEEIALRDVRDLQALHAALHGERTRRAGTRWTALQRPRAWVWAAGATAAFARR